MHWLDPDSLPQVCGTFECFLINPRGDVDGMLLAEGTEVHVPPHLSSEVTTAIRPGTKPQVKVRGIQHRELGFIAAVALDIEGKQIIDKGPPKGRKDPKLNKPFKRVSAEVQGTIRCLLHGPKGETRGVLLQDGACVRFPPHEADRLAPLLSRGSALAVRGEGLIAPLGTVIEAKQIGTSDADLQELRRKPKHARHRARAEDRA